MKSFHIHFFFLKYPKNQFHIWNIFFREIFDFIYSTFISQFTKNHRFRYILYCISLKISAFGRKSISYFIYFFGLQQNFHFISSTLFFLPKNISYVNFIFEPLPLIYIFWNVMCDVRAEWSVVRRFTPKVTIDGNLIHISKNHFTYIIIFNTYFKKIAILIHIFNTYLIKNIVI